MQDFQGKTAVVTGAGSGIGRGIALVLARQGVKVVVSDIEGGAAEATAAAIREEGGTARSLQTDVADLVSVIATANFAREEYGCVHILCNNAGVSYPCRGADATHQDWSWMLGVNLWGVIHGIEAFLPGMLEAGEEGHIVNTASMNGIIPSAYSPMYSTSKYGIVGLTDTLRNELKGTSISISVLCPAGVRTRIMDSERNRPPALSRPTPLPTHTPSASFELSPPLDPEDVGELVLQGIVRNQLYIFTDMKLKPMIEERHQRMMLEFQHLVDWRRGHPEELQ